MLLFQNSIDLLLLLSMERVFGKSWGLESSIVHWLCMRPYSILHSIYSDWWYKGFTVPTRGHCHVYRFQEWRNVMVYWCLRILNYYPCWWQEVFLLGFKIQGLQSFFSSKSFFRSKQKPTTPYPQSTDMMVSTTGLWQLLSRLLDLHPKPRFVEIWTYLFWLVKGERGGG